MEDDKKKLNGRQQKNQNGRRQKKIQNLRR